MRLFSGLALSSLLCFSAFPARAQSSSSENSVEQEIRLCTGDLKNQSDLDEAVKRCSPEQIQEVLKGITVIENEVHELNRQVQQRALDSVQNLNSQIEELSQQIEAQETPSFQISEGLLNALSVTGFSTIMVAGVAKAGTNLKAAGQNGYYRYQVKKDRATEKAHRAFQKRHALQTTKLDRLMKAGAISWLLAVGGSLINEASVRITVENDELEVMRQHLALLKTQYAVRKLNLITVQSAQASSTLPSAE